LRFSDFEVLLQIGEGGYGQVFLCRKQDTKELCAVKRMEKKRILERKKVENTFVERDVLTTTRSPWLVKLLYSFQDYHNVYLAMVSFFFFLFSFFPLCFFKAKNKKNKNKKGICCWRGFESFIK